MCYNSVLRHCVVSVLKLSPLIYAKLRQSWHYPTLFSKRPISTDIAPGDLDKSERHFASLTLNVDDGLQLEQGAVFVLLAVAVENVQLLVGEFQFADDGGRAEIRVQHYRHADLAVLLPAELLTGVLEGGATGVLANLQVPVTLYYDLPILVASFVVRTGYVMQY